MKKLSVLSLSIVAVYCAVVSEGHAAAPIGAAAVQPVAPTPVSARGRAGSLGAADLTNAVGVAAAVHGNVQAQLPGEPAREVRSGTPIFLGDQVSTDAKGYLQLMLRDQTTFTIGANSALAIDEFVYNPQTDAGKVGARVVKGVFRFVTGKVARKNPSDMTVKLPVGTIGIRGTIAAGRCAGEKSNVVLLGPGPNNNTGSRPGAIVLRNEVGTKVVQKEISEPGFGSSIEGRDAPPTNPEMVPPAEINALTGDLAPPPQENRQETGENTPGGGGASATEQSRQDQFEARQDVQRTVSKQELSRDLGDNTEVAAQDSAQTVVTRVQDGISKLEQLRTIQTGTFFYKQESVTLSRSGSSVGSYTIRYDINFGSRTVGGGQSDIFGSATGFSSPGSFDIDFPTRSFADGNGDATFVFSNIFSNSGCTTCKGDITVTLNNSGGTVGANASHSVTVSDNGSNAATGSGTAGRLAGSAPP